MPTPVVKLQCPHCGHYISYVVDVRSRVSTSGLMHTYRRRECAACRGRYTSLAEERAIAGSYTPPPRVTFHLEITTTSSGTALPEQS